MRPAGRHGVALRVGPHFWVRCEWLASRGVCRPIVSLVDVMIEAFKLASDPLNRLADIVRGADTNRHDIAPEAAGLLAVSLGLSRMHRDDLAQLDAGMTVYDALYRWARDAVDEGHDWPTSNPRS